MKMRTILLALAACAVTAFAAPAAPANWSHGEKALGEKATIGITGPLKLTTESGGVVECQVTYTAELEPGTTGTVKNLAPDNGTTTERCKTAGDLKECQVHKFEPTGLPWTMHTTPEGDITITTGEIHVSVTGASCPIAEFKTTSGNLTVDPKNPHAIGTVTLSGTLQEDVLAGGKAQLTVSGDLSVESPKSGTYGTTVPTQPHPPAPWGHEGFEIEENTSLGLTGSVKFTGATGGIECQITYGVTLEPGLTGKIESAGMDNGTTTEKCKGTGGLAFCQVHGFQPTGLPWTIHGATTFTISLTTGEIHKTTTGGFCPMSTITITPGTVTATVDNPNAIGAVALSGTLEEHLSGGAKTSVAVSGTLAVEAPNTGTFEL